MKLILILMAMMPLSAFASADCPAYPKEQRASEDTLKQALKDEGYTIKKFKIDGNCYEMYGKTRDGKKAEIYFDTKTGQPVKSEIGD